MADRRRAHPRNAPGPWFVDTTCINCDVVRQIAPDLYAEASDGLSYVRRQPTGDDEELAAMRGLLACPTGSVGGPARPDLVERAFPWNLDGPVDLLGYASTKSFGANSYLVERPDGNLMIDAPRWTPHLERAIEARGGLGRILLTHRDDVADAGRYAERFGSRVMIHEADASAAPRGAAVDTFADETRIQQGVSAVPTPGHTRGSAMFLVDDTYLFTGDSLYGSRTRRDLGAFPDATWYDWDVQADSLEALAARHRFEWVLPGHGDRFHAGAHEMHERLVALVQRMRAGTEPGEW